MNKLRKPFKELKRIMTKKRFDSSYSEVPFLERFKIKKKTNGEE